MSEAEREARRALTRLRRAVEKSIRELSALSSAVRNSDGDDFPAAAYEELRTQLSVVEDFLEEEEHRLRQKILDL